MSEEPFAVEKIFDLAYASPGGRDLLADLYLPQDIAPLRPAILWLHGGGWRFGDRKLAPDLGRYFAERGYVMVSVDYRRSKEAVFPAALEDVKTAIRWLKYVAAAYRIDPERIGLMGSSAGGHLAAMAAMTPGLFTGDAYRDQPDGVAAVVDAYGPSDFLQMDAHRDPEGKPSDDPESLQLPPGKLTADADSMESLFMGAPIESIPERVREANPASYAAPGLPPFFILHGLSDTAVPAHQSRILADALRAAGNDPLLALIDGLGHGFLNRNELDAKSWNVEFADASGTRREQRRIFAMIGDWFDTKLKGA